MADEGRSSAQFVVRRARHDEAPAVAEVWLRSRLAAIPAIPAPVHSDDEVRAWFCEVVLPEREVWVAEHDAELVAVMVLHHASLDQLYVLPGWTRRGVGSHLVGLAKELRPDGLDLWAFQSNVGALRFYEAHGFEAVATTDGENEERAPDVRYVWSRA